MSAHLSPHSMAARRASFSHSARLIPGRTLNPSTRDQLSLNEIAMLCAYRGFWRWTSRRRNCSGNAERNLPRRGLLSTVIPFERGFGTAEPLRDHSQFVYESKASRSQHTLILGIARFRGLGVTGSAKSQCLEVADSASCG